MIRPGANHIDRRRRLRPRDYLSDPHAFGRQADVIFRVPPGGDAVSAAVARVQHQLVLDWRAARPRRMGSRDARVFRISSSTWSSSVLGERWMGETVMAAVLHALSHR
ncbi:hypothetical protein [Geodermatophilus sp. CPCC 205506]|uniref:hypothetical protein n=1 Tax=Geodermatophilus sp. CPCC 205506 TaxID=2936596 RepID=UPI003EE86D94